MADYKIRIIVEGDDRASGPLRNVGSALGNMSQIAGGILGANLFSGLVQGIQSIASNAIGATAGLQQMQVGLESLVAREIAQQSASQAATDALAGITSEVMTIGEALPFAQDKAKDLMKELENIAIASPYQLETISNTFTQAMAFGYTTKEAKTYTAALLDMAAGTGANNERLGRMAYNLAQIRMQGKVTAMDVRQLAMAGFDLTSVLRYAGQEMGIQINTHEDFNKAIESGQITWEQFNDSFAKYSKENFGGASERMSRTLMGLQSTFKDIFVLTIPKIIGGAVEKFTGFASRILDGFLKIRDSGLLEEWGEQVSKVFDKVLLFLNPLADALLLFFDYLAMGYAPGAALRLVLMKLFGAGIVTQINQVAYTVRHVIGAVKEGVATITPYLKMAWEWIASHVQLKDVLYGLGLIILAVVIPSILSMLVAMLPIILTVAAVIGAVALLRTAWENNWGGIQEKTAAAWAWLQPILTNLWTWLQTNIPAAIETLKSFWETTLQPALQTFWDWVQTNVFPKLQDLWDWLQVKVPEAITTLKTFWEETLKPALQTFWDWVTTTVFPKLQELWDWLATNIPAAITTLKTFWDTELKPVLDKLVTLYNESVKPVLESFRDVLVEVGELGFKVLAGVWTEFLEPALTALWDKLKEIITWIGDGWKKTWDDFKLWLDEAVTGVNGVKDALSAAKDWLDKLGTALGNITLPDWLTPGSPTPFEMGLRGITSAMQAMNRTALPEMRSNLAFGGAGAGAGGRQAAPISVSVNATVSNDVDIELLAYRISKVIQYQQR